MRFQLTRGDAVAWLRTLPNESIDLVVTDPPYESLEKHRAIGTTTRLKHSKASSNDWFEIFPNARFPELFTEIYRVLKNNSHFYLFCDQETMFVAKPLAEAAGFKFWKPLIWDKCLGPDTLVWTERGVIRIADVVEGDRVALPEGGSTRVRATRTTRAPSLKVSLSDGTQLIASREHRFVRSDGTQCETRELGVGDALLVRPVRARMKAAVGLEDVSPADENRAEPLTVLAVEDIGEQDLVDISVEDQDELFLLGNGAVTHNCRIGMGYHYRAQYECILFFEKGKRKLNNLGISDIIEQARVSGGYPAEKPPEVAKVLIEQSTQPGDLVIDPFMGSGSSGFAAIASGRNFMGNDLCEEAVDITRKRLIEAGAKEPLRAQLESLQPQLGLMM
ncbi:MAG TPA: DNA methyltransferase [Kofleriaceae bacterium]|jgi:DNA modification methylase